MIWQIIGIVGVVGAVVCLPIAWLRKVRERQRKNGD